MSIIIPIDNKYISYQSDLVLSYDPTVGYFSLIFFFKTALEPMQVHTLLVHDFKHLLFCLFLFFSVTEKVQ